MKKHLRYKSTANLTREEWLHIRLNQEFIGGSDIGTILGHNPYCPALKLFHQKIGLWPFDMEDNEATYSGRVLEDVAAKYFWQFWDPQVRTTEQMIKNANAGKIIRKCQKVNWMIRNPDYPWLVVNLDREYYEDGEPCYLEIKTGVSYAVNKWESGLPNMYILQHQGCLGVSEMLKGEVGLYVDGRKFDTFPFSLSEDVFKEILKTTKDFYDRVVEGKRIMGSDLSLEEKQAAIAQLEPDPDGSEAFQDYLKERYRSDYNIETIIGTDELLREAKKYLTYHDTMNIAKEKKTEAGNILRDFMMKNNAKEIDFGNKKCVRWTKKSNGSDNFYVSPKILEGSEVPTE